MRKRSNVDRAFEAYTQMSAAERQDFSKLCQGYETAMSGGPKPAPARTRKKKEQAAPAVAEG